MLEKRFMYLSKAPDISPKIGSHGIWPHVGGFMNQCSVHPNSLKRSGLEDCRSKHVQKSAGSIGAHTSNNSSASHNGSASNGNGATSSRGDSLHGFSLGVPYRLSQYKEAMLFALASSLRSYPQDLSGRFKVVRHLITPQVHRAIKAIAQAGSLDKKLEAEEQKLESFRRERGLSTKKIGIEDALADVAAAFLKGADRAPHAEGIQHILGKIAASNEIGMPSVGQWLRYYGAKQEVIADYQRIKDILIAILSTGKDSESEQAGSGARLRKH